MIRFLVRTLPALVATALLVVVTGCGGGTSDDEVESFAIAVFEDLAAFDDVLAEAEEQKASDQIIVISDFSGCEVNHARATPRPDVVSVSVEFSNDIACVQAFDFRAIFLIDETGTNASGDWDYRDGTPDVVLLTR